ncbi:MAG: YihY/virulence factor BrkB family protein [Fulvimarina manganoxydans]|uniref:YihY/virulence factor BrkB family protein n=1 Tax=Fulvimarina manganoxydans TaxID=937218 RepID=UPI002354F75C|nr:YihY/virulence factor BrkB family protein [Fulvimarina manganoxydans]MCK5930947.1 YihY/virulence factor BrkB family protein [Fulvimarina manganoxydans]
MPSARGREAERPSDIPTRGWIDILKRVYTEIGDDRVLLTAGGVTYYLLLAFFPGLTALVSVYGLFADPGEVQAHLQQLAGILPGGALDIIEEQLDRIAGQGQTTVGLAFVASLLIALWSANAGMKALFEAMNIAYDEREERGFIWLTVTSFAFTLCAIAGVLLLIGVTVVMPVVLNAVGLGQGVEWLIRILSYVLILVLASLAAAALYRWGPDRAKAKWRWITPGMLVAVLVVAVVSVLFTWYVANFGSYNETYGSLGALIGFLTWIWISVSILIIGAELNAEMEHQTAADTTTPPERPLGQRGANMADHVAGQEATEAAGRQDRPRNREAQDVRDPTSGRNDDSRPRSP